jgi:c-di-GMP-binding flagellar brake protein YcgR
MNSSQINIGDRLEVVVKQIGSERRYSSEVCRLMDDRNFLISVPTFYGKFVKLPVEDEDMSYNFVFLLERDTISFEGKIIGYTKEDGRYMMAIKLTDSGRLIQRREFFRIDLLLPIKCAIVDDTLHNAPLKQLLKMEMFDGFVKDMSAGGIRIVANVDVIEQTKLQCLMTIVDETFIFLGVVMHRLSFPQSTYKYQYRIRFIGMRPPDQDKIMQYMFEQQRKVLITKEAAPVS